MGNRKTVVSVLLVALLVTTVGYTMFQLGYTKGVYIGEKIGINRQSASPVGHLTVLIDYGNTGHFAVVLSTGNVITNSGKNLARDQIGGTAANTFQYLQTGTGTGGGAGSNDLVTPFGARQLGAYAEPVAYNWTITTTFAAGYYNGENITEFGCFNAVSSGDMWSYYEDGGRTVTSADSLQVVWEYMIT